MAGVAKRPPSFVRPSARPTHRGDASMFSDAASTPTKFDTADWEAVRREIILVKDPVQPQPRDPTETARVQLKASYDAALEDIGDAMRKLSKPDNDVKETAHQGRQLCELAVRFLLAVRQAQPLPDCKADLGRELKQLIQRAGVEDPPPGFQGLDPFNVDPAISSSYGAWLSMLRNMETLRDLGNKGSHSGKALQPSDRSRIGDAAFEVAHAVKEVIRLYLMEQAQQLRPIADFGWLERLNTIERLLHTSGGLSSVGAELTEAGKAMSTLKDAPVAPATGVVIKWMAMNAKAKALTEQLEGDLESALGLSPPATAHDLAPLVELIREDDGAAVRPNVLAAEALHCLCSSAPIDRRIHCSQEQLAEMDAAMAQAAIDAGCLPPLIANLRSRCTDVAVAAARCLSALTDDASFRTAFKAAGGVRALLDLLATRTGGHVFYKTSGLPVAEDGGEQLLKKLLTPEEVKLLRAKQLVLASDSDPRMPANAWLLEAPPCAWGTEGFGPVALFVARLGRLDAEFYDAMVASGVIASIVAMVRGDRGDGGKSEEPWWAATALERLVVHRYSGEPCPPPHLNQATFSAAQRIVASGGGEALIFLARHGDITEAHAATNVLRRLVELGHVEAPSPWPMRRDGGGRVLNPWMEPARRRKMYGGEGPAVGEGAGASAVGDAVGAAAGELPAWALCPISLAPMLDPVMTSDGYTYERAAVNQWLRQRRNSPMTGAPLADTRLTPNFLVRSLVNELVRARES